MVQQFKTLPFTGAQRSPQGTERKGKHGGGRVETKRTKHEMQELHGRIEGIARLVQL